MYRGHGLVPWYLTFGATSQIKTNPKDATALRRGISRLPLLLQTKLEPLFWLVLVRVASWIVLAFLDKRRRHCPYHSTIFQLREGRIQITTDRAQRATQEGANTQSIVIDRLNKGIQPVKSD
jgi:hypothetical protein